MIRYCIFLLLMSLGAGTNLQASELSDQNGPLVATDLKVEYFTNPIGIDDRQPRLSWRIESGQRNTRQTAYQIQISNERTFAGDAIIWEIGKTSSEKSIHLTYKGPDLKSRQRYYWRVRVWDNHGNRSGWSKPAFWEMGLLNPKEWQARWIAPGLEQDTTEPAPSPMLRKEFSLEGKIQSARVYVTSHGLYEMKINGQKVGTRLFTPGWTSYNKRLQYQTYDITELLRSGNNAVGVRLGDGWYRGWIGFNNQRNFYGSTLGLLAQIEVRYANGETKVITTDESWSASTGAIRMSDIYDGETYDARLEKENWATPSYEGDSWTSVTKKNWSKDILVAPEGPPVRKIQQLPPVDILTTPEGDTIVDMGQNMVGWIRLNVEGKKGTKVTLTHAEVLDKEGNFYTKNLRKAAQKDTYILSGEGKETFEPHFTFHGFRYVKVEGYPGKLTKDDITGVVIHSDMKPTGHFATSNPLVNQLQHNIVWGQKGNFLDVPTDCPQRDERLGWTGDIQVFAQTACYNMDAAGFLTKWLRDLKADQLDNGSVPYVIPNVLGKNAAGASGWGDAAVIVPWTLYQAYGDKQILKTQYESMKAWVEYMRKRAQTDSTTYLWDSDFTFGDWLSFNSTASDYPGAYTDKNLISTAYFARSTDLLQRTAKILGKEEDAQEYSALLENIKQAFQNEYMTPSGRVMSNTQTSYLLALQFGLLSENKKDEAIQYLLTRINKRGHLTTGFLGTPHLNPVLSEYGHTRQAYELLLRKQYPSWLYPVTMGATTIWERWDGIKPDSTFQNPSMNSFNHYAYGAIGEWLYRTVAGIEADSPGYKQITIHPHPGGNLSYARSIKQSMYGEIESEWEVQDGVFRLKVQVPENTSATVVLPAASIEKVMESGKKLTEDIPGISQIEQQKEGLHVAVGSGTYRFSYPSEKIASKITKGTFDAKMQLGQLLANEEARAVLKEYIPDLLKSESLNQARQMTLYQIAQYAPDDALTQEKLKIIDTALRAINTDKTASLSINDKLAKLIANRRTRNLLKKHVPELMDSPWLSQVMGYSLPRAQKVLSDQGLVTAEQIRQFREEL